MSLKTCPSCNQTLDNCTRCSPNQVAAAQKLLDGPGNCYTCIFWDGRYSTGENRMNEEGFAFCQQPDIMIRAIPHAKYYKKWAAAIQTHQTFGCKTWKERVLVDRSTLWQNRTT